MKKVFVLMVLVLGFTSFNAQAAFLNLGFEQGNFSEWTPWLQGGSAAVVSSYTGSLSYAAPDGNYFAKIGGAGSADSNIYSSLNLMLGEVEAGTVISGWAAFDSGSASSDAFVGIINYANPVPKVWERAGGVDDDWAYWSLTIPETGYWSIQYAVRGTSYGLFDTEGIVPPNTVPEPTTLILFGLGSLGFVFLRRLKKQVG